MKKRISKRFSGLLPVVVDCETGGLNYQTDALLEVAVVALYYNEAGILSKQDAFHYHVEPFEGAVISSSSLEVTDIRPDHPFRFAVSERTMLMELSQKLEQLCQQHKCRKAVLVGHNAMFDLNFLQAAYAREQLSEADPFHRFVTLDTATLAGCWLRETVLAKAVMRNGLVFDVNEAHSALYDCHKTADLFCDIINKIDTVRHF